MTTIYTDGGCHNTGIHKGLGSWAFVEQSDKETVEVYCGYVNQSTNNRTEMLAVINAIKTYPIHSELLITSDSGYVVKGYNHPAYLDKWVQNGWRTSTKDPVSNQDLWEQLLSASYTYALKFKLVKGHYKDPDPIHAFWNAIVDTVCTYVIKQAIDGNLIFGAKVLYDIRNKKILLGGDNYGFNTCTGSTTYRTEKTN